MSSLISAPASQVDKAHRRLPTSYWLLAALSVAVYLLIAALAPLLRNANSLADINTFSTWPWGVLAYASLLAAAFGLYWLAYRQIQRQAAPVTLAAIVAPSLLFSLPLILTYPFNATDVYRYLLWGRMIAFERLNPYAVTLDALGNSAVARFAGEWGNETSPYGPVWQLAGAVLARLGGNQPDVTLGLIWFKILAVAAFVAVAVLIWLLLGRAEARTRAGRTLLWAWNPALLLSFAVNAHNDSLMLLWLILGYWVWRKGLPAAGLIVMMLAPLTKFSGLLPLPFFLIAALQEQPDMRRRLRLLLVTAAGSLAVGWLLFGPFGSPVALGQRLLDEGSGGGGFSPLAMLILAGRQVGLEPPVDQLVLLSMLLLMLIAIWLAWRTWRGRSSLLAAFDITAAYLLLAFRFRIWYAAWPLPWALLFPQAEPDARDPAAAPDPTGRRTSRSDTHMHYRLRASLWFLVTTQFSVLLYGQVRAVLLQHDMTLAHLLWVPFTFGLPLVLAAVTRPRRGAE